MSNNDVTKIKNTLAEWDDPTISSAEKKTVLITVMKHHQHLENVRIVLEGIPNRHRVPTLIIDDEADQASLNGKVNKGESSTTYTRIVSLKDALPHHTFIQYTATPQAPLLINLIDVLSPRFVQVLTPGEGYTGSKAFFVDRPQLTNPIPEDEIPTRQQPFNAPPDSLLFAMSVYFLGVASGLAKDGGKGNRSMMVHPSHKTIPHEEYIRWIRLVRDRWQKVLTLDSTDPDRKDLINEFKTAYDNLQTTVSNLPAFDVLVERLLQAVRGAAIEEVNARNGKTPTINWKNFYANILVGGQVMDRGFTVEGLTVTYMPRGSGISNADTIQQRARFFGYKQNYIDYCRVFLENRVRDAFQSYVLHEEDIRARLLEHDATGLPLTEWKRAFFLNRRLAPTRRGVIDLDYMRGNFTNAWFEPKAPHDSLEAAQVNQVVIQQFLAQFNLQDDVGDPRRTTDQRHKVANGIRLDKAFEELLVRLRVTRLNDSQKFTGALLQIQNHLESNPTATCTLFLMKGGELRERTTNENDEIPTLFQGRNPKTGKAIYPGDRGIVGEQEVTIQIHNLRVISGQDVYANIPAIAIRLSTELSRDWLVQERNSLEYLKIDD
ncbi:MAG: alpha-1,4 polygalactosaminidase [Leptolyngbyaceae cyanobacterium CSU_1_3]|nr:alpha-1,4 polygalactosaminidase [Leptolyngbyaceae cyanobacterium CSU_1_3]